MVPRCGHDWTSRWKVILLLALGPALLVHGAAPSPTGDSVPKLMSTTGGGKSQWGSIEEIKRAADKGDPAACNEYAILLEQGQVVPADFSRALSYYETAAKAGNRQSNFRLATIYHDGLGVKQDYGKAFTYYKQAAAAGDAMAQYNVGSMLVSARGMKRDWVEGLAWVIVATQNGAPAEGEQQVRARLAKQPTTIAAAEKRAKELRVELSRPTPTATGTPSPVPPSPTPGMSVPRPQIALPPPKLDVPDFKPTAPPLTPAKP